MSESHFDTKTIAGWIITILLAALSGTLASNSRNSDLEKDNREYKVRIEILEKNQSEILERVRATNDLVIEIKTNLKLKSDEKIN